MARLGDRCTYMLSRLTGSHLLCLSLTPESSKKQGKRPRVDRPSNPPLM